REVPGDALPLGRARLAVHRAVDPAPRHRELQRAGALRAEPALVDRAVRVALDLQQLRLTGTVLLGVRQQCAPDSAVGADGVGDGRAVDAQVQLDVIGRCEIEAERGDSDRASRAYLEELAPREFHLRLHSLRSLAIMLDRLLRTSTNRELEIATVVLAI